MKFRPEKSARLSSRLLKNPVILNDAQHREGSLLGILRLILAFARSIRLRMTNVRFWVSLLRFEQRK